MTDSLAASSVESRHPIAVLSRLPLLGAMALSALAGVAAGLGHVPFSLLPVSLLGLVALCWVGLSAQSRGRAFALGWAGGAGYFAITMFWITEPFQIDASLHGWMAPFALILLAVGLALFWGLAFLLAALIAPQSGWARMLALVAALSLMELARAYVFTGFPWGLVAYIWVDWLPKYWASLVGSHGLTALTLLLAGGAAVIGRFSKAVWLAVVMVGCFGVGALGVAISKAHTPNPFGAVVRLIQPNAPQDEKWDREKAPIFLQRQIDFTAAAPLNEGKRPDLVVWPETSIPYLLEQAGNVTAAISRASGGAPVVIGAMRRSETGGFHNSLAVIGAGGTPTTVYDKHHLVPFGEYMPFPALARATGIRGIAERADGGMVPGEGAALVDLGVLGKALALICYEAIFPQDVNAAPERPDFLLQITNDAWFGTFAGPYQHLAQARMRAVEQNLPMIRAANTGISAVIGPGGHIFDSIPLGEAGWIDVTLPPSGAPTLYSRTGDWPVFAVLMMLLCAAAFIGRQKPD